MKAINIKWDTDGDMEVLEQLPTEIELPNGMTSEDEISDYISFETGFCHYGFELEDQEKKGMNISELAYQLYIIQWKHEHITPEIEADAWKNYFEDTEDFTDYSFDDYLWDCGYANGTLYVCYEEFLNAEYLDDDYMKELFGNKKLYEMYKKDLYENFYTD